MDKQFFRGTLGREKEIQRIENGLSKGGEENRQNRAIEQGIINYIFTNENTIEWDTGLGNELPFANVVEQHSPVTNISKLEEIKTEGLLLLNLNVNSILANDGAKLIQLTEVFKKLSPAVVGITESWLTENNSNEEVEMEGYKLVRRDREGKRGGGVLVYIKEEYSQRIGLCEPKR